MAERDGLENRCVSNGTGGSNPSPSALVCVVTLRLQCHDTFLCTSLSLMGWCLTRLYRNFWFIFLTSARAASQLNSQISR